MQQLGPLITLMTDFGAGPYVAQMKGVMLSALPGARIVDITHDVPPQGIRHAQVWLRAAAFRFPIGTTHVVVVDPGVGTARRPIATAFGGHVFVGPDNGVLGWITARPEARTVVLDRRELFCTPVSSTFHGRDIFAPVAAELAAGLALTDVGSPIHDAQILSLPTPSRGPDGIRGHTLVADRFGNLLTNIPFRWLEEGEGIGESQTSGGSAASGWSITLADRPATLCTTYADGNAGVLLALSGSDGHLEFAIRNGSAADLFSSCDDLTVSCVRVPA